MYEKPPRAGNILLRVLSPVISRTLADSGIVLRRCRLRKFFDVCGGSLRVRADLHFGDPWAPDPACYLTDHEIGLNTAKQAQLERSGEIFKMP